MPKPKDGDDDDEEEEGEDEEGEICKTYSFNWMWWIRLIHFSAQTQSWQKKEDLWKLPGVDPIHSCLFAVSSRGDRATNHKKQHKAAHPHQTLAGERILLSVLWEGEE